MVPPMLLGFIVPITDRYLFLPSVGVCLLLAELAAGLEPKLARGRWLAWVLLAAAGAVWGVKTWNYVNEWRDPRSVWYGAHSKTPNSQVQQFLGEVYQSAGDQMDSFVKTGALPQWTNEIRFARAVLGDETAEERLRAEWTKAQPTRTNSLAYRDQLWSYAWQRFEESVARRGTLIAPNLFTCRGRLLVSQGKFAQAIPEFQNALAMARISTYAEIRYEGMTHALFNIGVCHWNMNNYGEAQKWILNAQAVQRESGRVWLPRLDQEAEIIKRLAAGK
jgi:tetratricopeptide (TPR) repeat protein